MSSIIPTGAGIQWKTLGEIIDPAVVKQADSLSCVPACGEMLLRDRQIKATQSIIATGTGIPGDAGSLVAILNRLDSSGAGLWQGGAVSIPGATREEIITGLNTSGSWGAVVWEQSVNIGHMVLIDGLDATGRVEVRDPWDGSHYQVAMSEFLQFWTDIAVFRSSS